MPSLRGQDLGRVVQLFLPLVAPIEEPCKYAIVRRWAFHHRAFNEPLDGIIYAAAAALGFATLENVGYMLGQGAGLGLVRGPLSVAHVLFSAFWGYALGMASVQTDPAAGAGLIRRGLFYAMLTHGVYDALLLAPQAGSAFVALPLLTIPMLVLLYRHVLPDINTSLANSPFALTTRRPPA